MRQFRKKMGVTIFMAGILLWIGCETPELTKGQDEEGKPLKPKAENLIKDSAADIEFLLEKAQALQFNKGDLSGAQQIYQNLLQDPSIKLKDRVKVSLLLSEALEGQNKGEEAIALIERMASEMTDREARTEFPQELRKRLSELVLGRQWQRDFVPLPKTEHSGAIMKLAALYPCDGKSTIYSFHTGSAFTFLNVKLSEAHAFHCLEQKKETEKRLGQKVKRNLRETHWGSDWTLIPLVKDQLKGAITFFIHDAKAHPIPRRYAKFLPINYEQMERHLASNQGLVAFDKKYGLPRVLVAAPDHRKVYDTIRAFLGEQDLPEDGVYVVNLAYQEKTHKEGQLDPIAIKSCVRAHWHQMKRCYENELKKDATLEGKVVVAFSISAAGSVREADIKDSTLDNQAVEECILQVFNEMKFPKPSNGGRVRVTYPIRFQSK